MTTTEAVAADERQRDYDTIRRYLMQPLSTRQRIAEGLGIWADDLGNVSDWTRETVVIARAKGRNLMAELHEAVRDAEDAHDH